MNKGINILKVTNYDEFKCTADKCKFTCCEGWDINIDVDTYNKWEKENNNIISNVKIKKGGGKTEYFINKNTHETCPFLDRKGLCEIVKSHGEEYLSSTCHMFPRIENVFEDKKELSLSCACPEVVELISKITKNLETDFNLKNDLLELKIREVLINIIRQENFKIEEKMIISIQMLLAILENDNLTEECLLIELERYGNKEYIQGLVDAFGEIELNINDSIEEINYLFLDIVQNYKEVSGLEILFEDINNFAENINTRSLLPKWKKYKDLFEQYDLIIENCIVAKIISSCVSEDIEEMAISFQTIIMEYLLIRYAVFLKYCMDKNKEIYIEDVKNYIVAFSRIIGNNTEAVKEFIKEGFGNYILEIGYLCFITLF
ncbi:MULTISPECIES: flagellin lysine-N-methylase [unclassified Clostridium]|uniref:flagellin lysine-N-methylase n=1 Tax=unclassified Clostridium TaxID=2614128 RepID=UPI0002982E1D|nr:MULTISPECIES: flagellin lysine-N-methylase [unclassified Clostridium]EKQ55515.1 MAG: hypothetical protein A370_02731 [Clostridium sp. Maddingley MBC34-26]